MPFLVLPETAQASAALAILRALSSLARTRASEVLTVVSMLMASMGASFRHHTCLPCGGSRAECEQSCGSFGPSWIIFGSDRFTSGKKTRRGLPDPKAHQVCLMPRATGSSTRRLTTPHQPKFITLHLDLDPHVGCQRKSN